MNRDATLANEEMPGPPAVRQYKSIGHGFEPAGGTVRLTMVSAPPTNDNMEPSTKVGTLILIATPIGNLEDITRRAEQVLREIDALACEDTRTTRKILQRYDIPRPKTLLSYHEHNEPVAGKRILAILNEGQSVALVSDGGYPGISDPGYRIVNAAIDAGHRIEVLPGASAPPMALLMSGLPTSSYTSD